MFLPIQSRSCVDSFISINPDVIQDMESLNPSSPRAPIIKEHNFSDDSDNDPDDGIGCGFDVVSDDDDGGSDSFEHEDVPVSAKSSDIPNGGIKCVPRVSNKQVALVIHLPSDHLRKIQVNAMSNWTLADVFRKISSKLSINKANRSEYSHVFFAWDAGRPS